MCLKVSETNGNTFGFPAFLSEKHSSDAAKQFFSCLMTPFGKHRSIFLYLGAIHSP